MPYEQYRWRAGAAVQPVQAQDGLTRRLARARIGARRQPPRAVGRALPPRRICGVEQLQDGSLSLPASIRALRL